MKDGRVIQVDRLLPRGDDGLEDGLHGEVDLDPLLAGRVVHDADVHPAVLDLELVDDQNLEMMLDSWRRQDLS